MLATGRDDKNSGLFAYCSCTHEEELVSLLIYFSYWNDHGSVPSAALHAYTTDDTIEEQGRYLHVMSMCSLVRRKKIAGVAG